MITKENLLDSSSTSTPLEEDITQVAFAAMSKKINELEGDLKNIKQRLVPEEEYFKTGTKINKVSLWIFILLPILQLIVTVVFLYIVWEDSKIIMGICSTILGLIGLGTIIELFYIPRKIANIEKKLSELN